MAKKPPRKTSKSGEKPLPTREQILAFIAEHPGEAGKREIARAFGITGSARVPLKAMLKSLAGEGLLESRRRRLKRPDDLPSVSVLSITGRDSDGELLAEPVEWPPERGEPPRILIAAHRKSDGPAAGVGDRVLARLSPGEPGGPAYVARVIKVLDRQPLAVIGVFRETPGGGGRIEPVDRKQKELVVAPGDVGKAQDGDLVSVQTVGSVRSGLGRAVIREVIGSMKSEKAVSLIAIYEHDIPHVFPADVLKEAEAAKPTSLSGREDWRDIPLLTIDPVDAKDHDDAVQAEPDPDPANPGGWLVTVAIADVAAYVGPGSALDREAMKRGNSVYFPDRVVPMLPERISNDLCSLRENEDRPALAVRMVFSAEGRKRRHRFHRIMMRSAAKLSYQRAQEAVDGNPRRLEPQR